MMAKETIRTGRYGLMAVMVAVLAVGFSLLGRSGEPATQLAAGEIPERSADAVPDATAESGGEPAEDAAVEGEPGPGESPLIPSEEVAPGEGADVPAEEPPSEK